VSSLISKQFDCFLEVAMPALVFDFSRIMKPLIIPFNTFALLRWLFHRSSTAFRKMVPRIWMVVLKFSLKIYTLLYNCSLMSKSSCPLFRFAFKKFNTCGYRSLTVQGIVNFIFKYVLKIGIQFVKSTFSVKFGYNRGKVRMYLTFGTHSTKHIFQFLFVILDIHNV
jgi:hypothetical protein